MDSKKKKPCGSRIPLLKKAPVKGDLATTPKSLGSYRNPDKGKGSSQDPIRKDVSENSKKSLKSSVNDKIKTSLKTKENCKVLTARVKKSTDVQQIKRVTNASQTNDSKEDKKGKMQLTENKNCQDTKQSSSIISSKPQAIIESQQDKEFVADEKFRQQILDEKLPYSPMPSMSTNQWERFSFYYMYLSNQQLNIDNSEKVLKAVENLVDNHSFNGLKSSQPLKMPICSPHPKAVKNLNISKMRQRSKSERKVTFNLPSPGCEFSSLNKARSSNKKSPPIKTEISSLGNNNPARSCLKTEISGLRNDPAMSCLKTEISGLRNDPAMSCLGDTERADRADSKSGDSLSQAIERFLKRKNLPDRLVASLQKIRPTKTCCDQPRQKVGVCRKLEDNFVADSPTTPVFEGLDSIERPGFPRGHQETSDRFGMARRLSKSHEDLNSLKSVPGPSLTKSETANASGMYRGDGPPRRGVYNLTPFRRLSKSHENLKLKPAKNSKDEKPAYAHHAGMDGGLLLRTIASSEGMLAKSDYVNSCKFVEPQLATRADGSQSTTPVFEEVVPESVTDAGSSQSTTPVFEEVLNSADFGDRPSAFRRTSINGPAKQLSKSHENSRLPKTGVDLPHVQPKWEKSEAFEKKYYLRKNLSKTPLNPERKKQIGQCVAPEKSLSKSFENLLIACADLQSEKSNLLVRDKYSIENAKSKRRLSKSVENLHSLKPTTLSSEKPKHGTSHADFAPLSLRHNDSSTSSLVRRLSKSSDEINAVRSESETANVGAAKLDASKGSKSLAELRNIWPKSSIIHALRESIHLSNSKIPSQDSKGWGTGNSLRARWRTDEPQKPLLGSSLRSKTSDHLPRDGNLLNGRGTVSDESSKRKSSSAAEPKAQFSVPEGARGIFSRDDFPGSYSRNLRNGVRDCELFTKRATFSAASSDFPRNRVDGDIRLSLFGSGLRGREGLSFRSQNGGLLNGAVSGESSKKGMSSVAEFSLPEGSLKPVRQNGFPREIVPNSYSGRSEAISSSVKSPFSFPVGRQNPENAFLSDGDDVPDFCSDNPSPPAQPKPGRRRFPKFTAPEGCQNPVLLTRLPGNVPGPCPRPGGVLSKRATFSAASADFFRDRLKNPGVGEDHRLSLFAPEFLRPVSSREGGLFSFGPGDRLSFAAGNDDRKLARLCTPRPVSARFRLQPDQDASPELFSGRPSTNLVSCAPIETPLVLRTLARDIEEEGGSGFFTGDDFRSSLSGFVDSFGGNTPEALKSLPGYFPEGGGDATCKRLDFADSEADSSKEDSQKLSFQNVVTHAMAEEYLADRECCELFFDSRSPVVSYREYLTNPIANILETGDEMHFVPIVF